MSPPFDQQTVLIIIDVQKAFDSPLWRDHNNPALVPNLRRVLDRWRALGRPVYFVAHDSRFPDSPYRRGQPGNDFHPELTPLAAETVIRKRVNCAFIGTDLEARLREAGHETLVVGGVATHNSLESTVRVAGDLGFRVHVLADGTATVGRTDRRGQVWSADDVHHLSLSNMDGEYATVIDVADALG